MEVCEGAVAKGSRSKLTLSGPAKQRVFRMLLLMTGVGIHANLTEEHHGAVHSSNWRVSKIVKYCQSSRLAWPDLAVSHDMHDLNNKTCKYPQKDTYIRCRRGCATLLPFIKLGNLGCHRTVQLKASSNAPTVEAHSTM